jgi:chromosome segregation ATPase
MSKQSERAAEAESRRELTSKDIETIDQAISSHEVLGGFLYRTRYIFGQIGKLEQHYRGLKQAIEVVEAESGRISSELEGAKARLAEAQQQEVKTRQRVAELTAEAAEKERMLTAYSQTIDRITGKAA